VGLTRHSNLLSLLLKLNSKQSRQVLNSRHILEVPYYHERGDEEVNVIATELHYNLAVQ
jgi:hypothetical protein